MKGRMLSISLVLACNFTVAANADTKPARPKAITGDVYFQAVSDLTNPGANAALRGARTANPAEYTACFYSRSDQGDCTSTLVGPRVLLTAAHCVSDKGEVILGRSGERWNGICTHAPEYATNETADWALCLLDKPMPGVEYERISTDGGLLKEKDEIQLTGFGCTQADGSGGNDGTFRIGEAPIRRLPAGDDHDIITQANTVVCPGDSGGPAFRYVDAVKGKRVQVSVNSRVSVTQDGTFGNTSYLSSLTTPAAARFIASWKQGNGVKICGVDSGVAGCRK
jgi:hypothetical protein